MSDAEEDTGPEPKADLTRLESFESDHDSEPAGPDLGELLGLKTSGSDLEPLLNTESIPPPEDDPAPEAFSLSDPVPPREAILPTSAIAPVAPPPFRRETTQITPSPALIPSSEDTSFGQVRRFSEQMSVGKESVPAAYPFSLRIDGKLAPEEQEKLLDVLSRQNLGIREVDLEPQFAEGRILIPRISEFAAILIIQAMRSSAADIRFGPADRIYATDDTRTQQEEEIATQPPKAPTSSHDPAHPAERLPITAEPAIPGWGPYVVVDVVTASAALSVQAVEAVRSNEYQEMLEALQRELKFKAWRKGATAVVNFAVQLNFLSLPSRYRVLVTGSAVRSSQLGPS